MDKKEEEEHNNSMLNSMTSLDKSVIETSSMVSLDQITSDNLTDGLVKQPKLLNNNNSNNNTSLALNEKVATLASSIYTELEKIVKVHGRDTVKDLMSIVVNVLEALDAAIQEKEELLAENELLRDDYEKLLNQYEREKQVRKETELVSTRIN